MGREVVIKWHCYSANYTRFTCCKFRTVPYHTQHDTYSNCCCTNVVKTVSPLFASKKMLFHLSMRTSVLVPQHLGTHTNNHYSGNLVLIASRKHRCKDEGVDSNNYVSKLKYTLYACIGLYVQYIRTIDAETSTFTEGMVYGPQVNPYLSVFCVWQTDIPQSLLPFLVLWDRPLFCCGAYVDNVWCTRYCIRRSTQVAQFQGQEC